MQAELVKLKKCVQSHLQLPAVHRCAQKCALCVQVAVHFKPTADNCSNRCTCYSEPHEQYNSTAASPNILKRHSVVVSSSDRTDARCDVWHFIFWSELGKFQCNMQHIWPGPLSLSLQCAHKMCSQTAWQQQYVAYHWPVGWQCHITLFISFN